MVMFSLSRVCLVLAAIAQVSLSSPIKRATPSIVKGNSFDRFVVIVLENTDYADAMGQTYLANLGQTDNGVVLTSYSALTHPSQPNYIAMIKGDLNGVTSDSPVTLTDKTIVDLLEPKGITWKAYAENYLGNCTTDTTQNGGLYARKHVPFISFSAITSNKTRCANIVPATQLTVDVANNNVPQFVFYTPNMNNDGHDTSVSYASNWLQGFLEPLLKQPAFSNNTVVLVTFDEQQHTVTGVNHVYSALVGGAVKRNSTTDSTVYNHYSILKTLEANWNLGNLAKNDVSAIPFVTHD